MPITAQSLATTIYDVGAPQVIADVVPLRGDHKVYTTAAARINANWTPMVNAPHREVFQGTPNAGGNAIYLPYNDDKITSVRLPVPAPVGVTLFLTANMSGCRFYIDTIGGSADLMVYHANTHQFPSPVHNSPVNTQFPGADGVLTGLHAAAQGDYAPLVLNNVFVLPKVVYYGNGALLEQRKANQGRRLAQINAPSVLPEFFGGCTVVGLPGGPHGWRFYYQAWGDVLYSRKGGKLEAAKDLFTFSWNSLHKKRTEGLSHGVNQAVFRVVDHVNFY